MIKDRALRPRTFVLHAFRTILLRLGQIGHIVATLDMNTLRVDMVLQELDLQLCSSKTPPKPIQAVIEPILHLLHRFTYSIALLGNPPAEF